ncbi:MAG: H+/Na+-translocating ferredoxin:NAD+ oxidoreductase subunit [Pseudomonadota bacterium]|nr:H+/Na+-translocating ferredoxin:NAD+ oxidoreductase subunit [Pseudomonadota bacterium]
MKNQIKTQGRQIIATAMVLALFGLAGGLLVGVIYEATAEQVAENQRRAMLANLNQLLQTDRYDNDLLASQITLPADERLGQKQASPAYIARLHDEVTAVIFSVIAPDGYSGAIKLLVCINADGTLNGVRVVQHRETPGLGDLIETARSKWIFSFDGKSLDNPDAKGWKVKRDGGVFDQFTGATITPRAVVKAVHQCLLYFDRNKKQWQVASSK